MHLIWKDNSEYRVFTNFWRSFAQEIMNKEDLINKYEYIDVNKCNCKTAQALVPFQIKGNPRVALYLHCWTTIRM